MTDPKVPRTPEQEKQFAADQAAREAKVASPDQPARETKEASANKARHEGTVS